MRGWRDNVVVATAARAFARTITRSVAPALGAALALAGCSGGFSGSVAADPAAATSDAATASSTTSTPTASAPSSAAPATVAGAAESAEALARRMTAALRKDPTVRFSMVSADGSFEGNGAMDVGKGTTKAKMTMSVGGRKMQMVMLPKVLYISSDLMGEKGKWLVVRPGANDPMSRASGDVLDQMASGSDITASIRAFGRATKFSVVGTETIDGVQTTRYHVELDEAGMIASIPKRLRSGELLATMRGATSASDIYLGANDLPVRVETRGSVAGAGSTMEITYFGWGEPVSIKPPARSALIGLGSLT